MKKLKNHLKLDPSRTALIRRQWAADTDRRFQQVRRQVYRYVAHNDEGPFTINASFTFATIKAKVTAFRRWLGQKVNAGVLEANPITGEPRARKPWFSKYIDSAYRKGIVRAYSDTHTKTLGRPVGFDEGSKEQFVNQAFAAGERTDKLERLYTRAYEDLKGVTDTMAAKMSKILTEGLAHGDHPLKTAAKMSTVAKKLSKTRAKVIALSETVSVHAEGQLDGMEDLGVVEVGADVEFSTAGDNIVCPKCKALNGKVFTIAKARGIITVHPLCRCAWIPVVNLPAGVTLNR